MEDILGGCGRGLGGAFAERKLDLVLGGGETAEEADKIAHRLYRRGKSKVADLSCRRVECGRSCQKSVEVTQWLSQ